MLNGGNDSAFVFFHLDCFNICKLIIYSLTLENSNASHFETL